MPFQFFQPTPKSLRGSATTPLATALDALVVRPGMPATVGLWGFGYNGDPLELRAYRGALWVSKSSSSPVTISRTVNDPKQYIQEFTVTGLREGDTLVGVSASGRPMTDPLPVYELRGTPTGVMREAANSGQILRWHMRGIFGEAIPYLALKDKNQGDMPELIGSAAGAGPLMNVHGLSVHSTAGRDDRSAYGMARWGCLPKWNKDGIGAHFGIAGDGTLVQFTPTTFAAFAQYSPGNEHWISVEVDNTGKVAMNAKQLATLRKLFGWVADTYGVPREVAMGTLFPKAGAPEFDKATEEVCERADAATTTDAHEAAMSSGASCHWWLEKNKTNHSHGCPGPKIINQLDEVAKG